MRTRIAMLTGLVLVFALMVGLSLQGGHRARAAVESRGGPGVVQVSDSNRQAFDDARSSLTPAERGMYDSACPDGVECPPDADDSSGSTDASPSVSAPAETLSSEANGAP